MVFLVKWIELLVKTLRMGWGEGWRGQTDRQCQTTEGSESFRADFLEAGEGEPHSSPGISFSPPVLEKIRSAVGSTQLLLSQKVQQFFRLCQQSMDPTAFPVPTFQDLAGFWDLLQLSIEDVTLKFLELQQLKANSWKLLEPKEEKKVPPPIPKKPSRGRGVPVKERSLDSVDRQRQEARKRLLAAKRAASFRHSSATESADSIEIYIPEAQTRL